jgi:hypothetical protein
MGFAFRGEVIVHLKYFRSASPLIFLWLGKCDARGRTGLVTGHALRCYRTELAAPLADVLGLNPAEIDIRFVYFLPLVTAPNAARRLRLLRIDLRFEVVNGATRFGHGIFEVVRFDAFPICVLNVFAPYFLGFGHGCGLYLERYELFGINCVVHVLCFLPVIGRLLFDSRVMRVPVVRVGVCVVNIDFGGCVVLKGLRAMG